jgi:hypothetical protein
MERAVAALGGTQEEEVVEEEEEVEVVAVVAASRTPLSRTCWTTSVSTATEPKRRGRRRP